MIKYLEKMKNKRRGLSVSSEVWRRVTVKYKNYGFPKVLKPVKVETLNVKGC